MLHPLKPKFSETENLYYVGYLPAKTIHNIVMYPTHFMT